MVEEIVPFPEDFLAFPVGAHHESCRFPIDGFFVDVLKDDEILGIWGALVNAHITQAKVVWGQHRKKALVVNRVVNSQLLSKIKIVLFL